MVHTKTDFLCVLIPSSSIAPGLLECNHALCELGITEVSATQFKKLVWFGTDGAAANIKNGLIEKEHNRIFWMWCLAHGLELSVRDCFLLYSF